MNYEFTIVGGDARQRYTAEALRRQGHTVHTFSVPGLPDTEPFIHPAQYVILPIGALPVSPATMAETIDADTVVFGGKTEALRPYFSNLQDYLTWESLAIANAVPTAEGAIQLAMEHMPDTISGSRFLVVGAGRIGMCLALKLQALGGYVTVSARRSNDIARICTFGLTADITGQYDTGLRNYDCVFNTVPSPVFTPEQMSQIPTDSILIELASAPGGFPKGLRPVISGAALPGRVAPKAAGELLAREILTVIRTL